MSEVGAVYEVRPTEPRWTHIALRVDDIDATIAWYEEFTPMVLLTRHADDFGYGAWMGQSDSPDRPFILVHRSVFPGDESVRRCPQGSASALCPHRHRVAHTRGRRRDRRTRGAGRVPRARAAADAAASRIRVHAPRSRREHGRVLVRPGCVRDRTEGVGRSSDLRRALQGQSPRPISPRLQVVIRRRSRRMSLTTSSTNITAHWVTGAPAAPRMNSG